jgi:putative ABC transport system permease protein
MLRSSLAAALANLTRNWPYTSVIVTGLAVSLAAAILVGLFVRDELSYDRWLPDHARLYLVTETLTPPGGGRSLDREGTRADIAALMKLDFPQVEAAARMMRDAPILRQGRIQAEEDDFFWADPDLLDLLRLPAVAGDPRTALRSPDALVLTRAMARKYFGRDAPLGELMVVDRALGPAAPPGQDGPHVMRVRAVIEDLPSNTHLKIGVIASGAAAASPLAGVSDVPINPFAGDAYTYVRLRTGASGGEVEAALPGFAARHIASAPLMGSRMQLHLAPITSIHLAEHAGDVGGQMTPAGDRRVIASVAAVAVLIVLVGAINFVTLVTARSSRRAVEVGVRKALGARRRDLAAQFMGEAILLVALSMLMATALAELTLPVLNKALGRTIAFDYLTDPQTAAVLLAATLGIGVLAGLYPALVLSSFRPAAVLKGGRVNAAGSVRLREGLVLAQFAVLIGLSLAAATLYRQTEFALARRLQAHSNWTLWIDAPCVGSLRERILAVNGVNAAVCSSVIPLSNGGAPTTASGPDGRVAPVQMAPLEFGFFEFYGLKPVAGRTLQSDHGEDARLMQPTGARDNPSVMLNETAARRLGFPSPGAAVGRVVSWRRLVMSPNAPPQLLAPAPSTVAGVTPDFSMGSVRSAVEPMIFYVDPSMSSALSVRLSGHDVPGTLAAMDRMWRGMGNERPMRRRFLDQAARDLYSDIISQDRVLAISAGLAILISCLGLFALAAFTAERRTKEIGVRKAMGAGTFDVVRLLLWQFTRPVLWANLIAWPLGWWVMDRWLQGFAYRVDLPPWLFAAASGAAVLIAWATVSTHAFLVARARPVTALRYE